MTTFAARCLPSRMTWLILLLTAVMAKSNNEEWRVSPIDLAMVLDPSVNLLDKLPLRTKEDQRAFQRIMLEMKQQDANKPWSPNDERNMRSQEELRSPRWAPSDEPTGVGVPGFWLKLQL